jgi:hypothetical protein
MNSSIIFGVWLQLFNLNYILEDFFLPNNNYETKLNIMLHLDVIADAELTLFLVHCIMRLFIMLLNTRVYHIIATVYYAIEYSCLPHNCNVSPFRVSCHESYIYFPFLSCTFHLADSLVFRRQLSFHSWWVLTWLLLQLITT